MENTIPWLIWIALFFVIEGEALFRGSYKGTLTAHLRRWFGMETDDGRRPKAWRARRAALLGFLAWLVAHLVFPAGTF